jgi:oxygen-independent coproporphyrinogen-3 oxidase
MEEAKEMTGSDSLELMIDGRRLRISSELLGKYNQPGPRYTSYPTAPEWDETFGPVELREAFDEANSKAAPLSLYFHIPFCNSLCLYCGCNVVISKNHEVAIPYLVHLKREIDRVSSQVGPGRQVKQLHWGGGTPTYLSSDQIEELFTHIRNRFSIARDAEIGVEIDPRATTEEQCGVLKRLGFNRLSMGIQDFDPLVQKTVHRVQTYEMIESLFNCCRELGFESINMDLIYGLPHQTMESFSATVDKIIAIDPDRIAVFSYAHVPWMKKQQGSFARFLPEGVEKFRIWSKAIEKLTGAGYRYIGMDHFARPTDELCQAQDDRTLHRNFQGYTTKGGCDLYGMGVSAISGLEDVYAQNWRELPRYYQALDENRLPTMRGIRVSPEDKLRRAVINRLLCHCVVVKSEIEREFGVNFNEKFAEEINQLEGFDRDGLVMMSADRIEVVGLGRIFIRNVAMAFDQYARQNKAAHQTFSKTL